MTENRIADRLSDEDKRFIKALKVFSKNVFLILSIVIGIVALPFILDFRSIIFDLVFIISAISGSIILFLVYKKIIFFNQILEELISGKRIKELSIETQDSFYKKIRAKKIYLFCGILFFLIGAISLLLVMSTYYLSLPGLMLLLNYWTIDAYLIWIKKLVSEEKFET